MALSAAGTEPLLTHTDVFVSGTDGYNTYDGKTFGNERLISNDYAAYSELTILKDATVGVLWERGVERGYQFITFTRLNRDWLAAASASAGLPSPRPLYKVISEEGQGSGIRARRFKLASEGIEFLGSN